MDVPDDARIGQVLLGKLFVVRRLGGGGMGVVYEVEHRLTGHRRALKVVQAKYADRPRFMKRLLREARVAGRLDSPYVAETYDAGRLEDGSAYVLMELLEGESLYEHMERRGRLEPERVARIMAQLAEGMAVAHEAGIIHRDLKPENVFLVRDAAGEERVKILDFGVSQFNERLDEAPDRLTAEGTLVGTPFYMSPEQASGRPVDARTDIWAIGVMMYETLSARLPFEAATVGALFVKIGAGERVDIAARCPDLDPGLADIVRRALATNPDDRFPDAEALRRALLPFAGGRTASRARTISDRARATLDYEPLPEASPSNAKRETQDDPPRASAQADEPARDTEASGRVLSAPPSPATRGIPGWGWALVGVAIGLVLILSLRRLADEPTPTEPPPSPTASSTTTEPLPPVVTRERTNPTPPSSAAPPENVDPIEDEPSEAEPREAPSPPRPRPSRAHGLDPNPYR